MIKQLVNKLHQSKYLGIIFHTLDDCLQKELKECETVLDLGCGPASPIRNCRNIKYSVGVEPYLPYLKKSKNQGIHTKYIHKKIEDLDFPINSFDAVMMIEVLEHLPKKTGLDTLKKAEKWAKKKIVISSPNGFLPQKSLDDNPLQKHLSGWGVQEMINMDFKVYGLAGLKVLRQQVQEDTMGDNMLTTIKFKPKIFWFVVATLSQLLVYYFPRWAFELFCVKYKNID